ncbi:MAG: TIGR04222 domain-containing membrane protein [Pseudomonadota bacterium]
MNIFDMRGPEFLAVYLLASVVGLIVLYVASRRASSQSRRLPSGDARRQLRDPYLLAFLRAGARQTLQTVAFSLCERRLLSVSKKGLIVSGGQEALRDVTHPLEVAVLAECKSLRAIGKVLHDRRLTKMAENYAAPLRESGLMADNAEYARRLPAFLTITGALLSMAVIKVCVALNGGHSNIAFLAVLTVLAMIAAVIIFRRRRTGAGDRALADQQTLFAQLKGRVKGLSAGGATNEVVLVAAAFGLAALPPAAYPFADTLHRQAQNSAGGGSGCGSGGGGGGGGGGCGGCGGCGGG